MVTTKEWVVGIGYNILVFELRGQWSEGVGQAVP